MEFRNKYYFKIYYFQINYYNKRPERWLSKDENKTIKEPYSFIPFNAGARNCIR